MTENDLLFFQELAEKILIYCASSRLKNEDAKNKVIEFRNLIHLVNETSPSLRTLAPMRNDVVSKLNKRQNRQPWTIKELKELPYLKDLKYRITQSGIHQFRYRRDGFNVSFNSKNYEVAKKKAKAFILDLKRKMGAEIKVKHVNSLDYVANLWFENKKAHVGYTTWRAYKSVYVNHIMPKFGSKMIANILPMDLQPFFNDLHERLGKTCENCKVILAGTFELAVANRLCPSNPMKGVIIERHCRKPGVKLTIGQIERFKNVMYSLAGEGTAYLIILYSGIRGAELERMQFDWDRGFFTVYNAKLKKSQKARPENLTRTVPIFPALYKLRHRIEKEDWRFDLRKISNMLCRFWTETTVKDLRHTFTSIARESGVENELVNLWTGHLPGTNVTANVYTHFSDEYQLIEAKKIKPY